MLIKCLVFIVYKNKKRIIKQRKPLKSTLQIFKLAVTYKQSSHTQTTQKLFYFFSILKKFNKTFAWDAIIFIRIIIFCSKNVNIRSLLKVAVVIGRAENSHGRFYYDGLLLNTDFRHLVFNFWTHFIIQTKKVSRKKR